MWSAQPGRPCLWSTPRDVRGPPGRSSCSAAPPPPRPGQCPGRQHAAQSRRGDSACTVCKAVGSSGVLGAQPPEDLSQYAALVPPWLPDLLPGAQHALMMRRDPKLAEVQAADATSNLAALRSLMADRDVTKMVVLAPELLRQKPTETRQLMERLRANFPNSDVAQMAYNRPQLLLARASAGMLDVWSKRVRKTTRKAAPKKAPSAEPADGDAEVDGEDEEAALKQANEEAAAAARKAIEEIVAAGGPVPRGFGSRAAAAPAAAPAPPVRSAPAGAAPPRDDGDEGGDAEDEDGGDDTPLSEAAVAEFEAALEEATRKAKAVSTDEREAIIAKIEARWASRRGNPSSKPGGAAAAAAKKRGSPVASKGAGARGKDRRERDKVQSPWLAAPWARPEKQQQLLLLQQPADE